MIEILSLSKRLPHMLTLLTQRLVPIKEVFGIGFDLDLVQPSFTRFRYPLRCFIGICLSLSSPLFTKVKHSFFLAPNPNLPLASSSLHCRNGLRHAAPSKLGLILPSYLRILCEIKPVPVALRPLPCPNLRDIELLKVVRRSVIRSDLLCLINRQAPKRDVVLKLRPKLLVKVSQELTRRNSHSLKRNLKPLFNIRDPIKCPRILEHSFTANLYISLRMAAKKFFKLLRRPLPKLA